MLLGRGASWNPLLLYQWNLVSRILPREGRHQNLLLETLTFVLSVQALESLHGQQNAHALLCRMIASEITPCKITAPVKRRRVDIKPRVHLHEENV